MATRIEIITKLADTRAAVRTKKLQSLNKLVTDCAIVDVYTVDKSLTQKQLETIASRLANPLTQTFSIGGKQKEQKKNFSYAIEIGFLPGITDNIATTTKEIAQDLLKVLFKEKEAVYNSQITFLSGKVSKQEATELAA